MKFSWRGMTARPANDLKVRSSLVRRLVQAQDDPAKRRIRAWLCDLNDEQLLHVPGHCRPARRGNRSLVFREITGSERKTTMTLLWLVGLFAMFISPVQAHEEKDITVTQLLSSTMTSSGQPIVLPQKDAQIVVSIHDAMPGATLQAHNHPYPRYVYVLSGNLQVNNIVTGQTDIYKAGSFILEPVGEWQTVASIGSEPLKLLVIDIVEHGQSNTVQLN